MAIDNIGIGTWTAGTGALTVPVPANTVSGDLLMVFVSTSNAAVATPSNWSLWTGSPVSNALTINTALASRLTIFYRYQDGTVTSCSLTETSFNNREAQMMSLGEFIKPLLMMQRLQLASQRLVLHLLLLLQ